MIPQRIGALVTVAVVMAAVLPASAQDASEVETFEATTTNMHPADLEIRINVLRWPDEAAREPAVTAVGGWLASGAAASSGAGSEAGEGQAGRPLAGLETVGFIWTGGSLGYSLKYAHREVDADGGEHIVVVTDRPLGTWGRDGLWHAEGEEPPEHQFTVVAFGLDPDGTGDGSMSLSAPVVTDPEAQTIELGDATGPTTLLSPVRRHTGY